MFISKKIALRKTRVHSDDGFLDKAYIPKGTVYYQISNGTHGRGARNYNMSEKAMTALIASDASAWSKGIRLTQKDLTPSNVIQFPVKQKEYDIDADVRYTADDIPF